MTKLTLNVDSEVIKQAKQIADETGTSVSSIFERFIRLLAGKGPDRLQVGPLTRKATGIVTLPRGTNDRELVADALVKKYEAKK